MGLKNTERKYGSIAVALHWFIALMILGQLALGLYMVELPDGLQKIKFIGWHKEIGVSILFLALLRLAWRMRNISPLPTPNTPFWQDLAARTVHFLLYIAMLTLPLTGWMLSSAAGGAVSFFGLFTMPNLIFPNESLATFLGQSHKWLAIILIGLIFLHVGAVFCCYIFL